jgi:hypothetical protein
VKLVRVLSRLALLSLAAAVFVGLTGVYGGSVPPPVPGPRYQAKHRNPPASPQSSEFLGFVRAGVEVALFAVAGRIGLRLRLSPVPHNEGHPILLDLNQTWGRNVL